MNKSVIVTGGAKGIGKSISEKFAKNGYNVFINYLTSENEAIKLKENLINKYSNIKVEIYKADISKRDEVTKMIKHMLKVFGRIDVLVNNAGVANSKLFTEITEEEYNKIFDTNVKGTFNVTQEVVNTYMLNEKKGAIINISSIWGVCGASMEVLYSSSKAAIIGITKALARELGLSNIRVNAVAPGWIETDMTKEYNEEERESFKNDVSLNKLGTPENIADVVYFLASEKSSYITGQVIISDGGFLT